MINVGTKLKSIRTGEVVEVLELASGQKKVRKADGTEKYLSDCNIARWYDEVVEQVAPQVEEKAVKSAPVKENDKKGVSQQAKTKKSAIGEQLKQQFEATAKDNQLNLVVMKRYSLLSAGDYKISQVHFKKKSICCQLKPKDILDSFKNYVVKYPDSFRLSYGYAFNILDAGAMKKFFESVAEIIKSKQEKK